MTEKEYKIHCSRCTGETSHQKLFDEYVGERKWLIDAEHDAWFYDGYQYTLFKCAGCSNVVLRKAYECSEIDPRDYDDSYITWHPPKAIKQPQKWYRKLPKGEQELLNEVLISMNTSCFTVSAMGLRAILDMFIVRSVGDSGSFKAKLNKMVTQGFLSARQVEIIEPVLNLGSAASHRGYTPDSESIQYTFDVIENLLHQDIMGSNVPLGVSNAPKRN